MINRRINNAIRDHFVQKKNDTRLLCYIKTKTKTILYKIMNDFV